jgi:hypothetical protein
MRRHVDPLQTTICQWVRQFGSHRGNETPISTAFFKHLLLETAVDIGEFRPCHTHPANSMMALYGLIHVDHIPVERARISRIARAIP